MSTVNKVPVADYLSKHNMQKLIEEAVNDCYASQSSNPVAYMADYFGRKGREGKIAKLIGREVLDSRGNPTVEVDVYCDDESRLTARASVPSGASTGSGEATELRDGDKKRYLGKGCTIAAQNVSTTLNELLRGSNVSDLSAVDDLMIKADGTENKSKIGGNAITATSFAVATAGAVQSNEQLFEYLARQFNKLGKDAATATASIEGQKFKLPTPLVNILNGGKHAGGKLKIQEFMIVPRDDIPFRERLRYVTEVYHSLGKVLVEKKGLSAKNVGDEGGFAPDMASADETLGAIEEAIEKAGYKVGEDIKLALDCAASEFYDRENKQYEVEEGRLLTSEEMVDFYEKLLNDHPALVSIEDGLDEQDYEGWAKLTERLGNRIMIVGDDLYCTQEKFIRQGIENKWANALLLKVNQVGTITEAMQSAKLVLDAGQNVIVSHRSGETDTTLIADLAVGIGARYIKTGATARMERVAKYNRLLQIEELLRERGLLDE